MDGDEILAQSCISNENAHHCSLKIISHRRGANFFLKKGCTQSCNAKFEFFSWFSKLKRKLGCCSAVLEDKSPMMRHETTLLKFWEFIRSVLFRADCYYTEFSKNASNRLDTAWSSQIVHVIQFEISSDNHKVDRDEVNFWQSFFRTETPWHVTGAHQWSKAFPPMNHRRPMMESWITFPTVGLVLTIHGYRFVRWNCHGHRWDALESKHGLANNILIL